MLFDRASFTSSPRGTPSYYGSSADGQIHALDAETGQEKWTYFTDGPVRFAPAVWRDQVYAVSDDGYLYCLSAVDGALIRKWRGGPGDDMVLGNGTLTSRWPPRGGPVIFEDTLYYAAGIWQSEKVFIHALDLKTGENVWTNADTGQIEMPQPHGGANANSGVSAQGYLVATADQLFVPTGRAVPAAFQRSDGAFQYYHLQQNGHTGGTSTMAAGPFVYNGGLAFVAANGEVAEKLGAGAVAAFPAGIFHADGNALRALKPIETTEPDRRGEPQNEMEARRTVEGGKDSGRNLVDRRRRNNRFRRKRQCGHLWIGGPSTTLVGTSRRKAVRIGGRQWTLVREHGSGNDLLFRRGRPARSEDCRGPTQRDTRRRIVCASSG